MEIRHLAFFEFGAEHLEDGFLYDLRKPDEGFLMFDDDGYGGERKAEKIISSRKQAGLPDAPVLHEMTDQKQRVFIPYEVREATVVHGSPEQVSCIMQTIRRWVKTERQTVRGYQCGAFRWGGELLWMHFLYPAPVAAVAAADLRLKSYRYSPQDSWQPKATATHWRDHLSGRALMNK